MWKYFIHSREEKRYLIHILDNDFFGLVFLRIIGFKKVVKIPKYVHQKNKIVGMYIYEKSL
ncbi:hypothetical protein BN424_3615 [Carnobacterium maltaromaticum LMA28]|uniref:Uncharacterized protein n=1 Tax=Carnobacterium maltaromaticum LMA28 TaxID=1234679 RepID=K8E7S5_CARML|nr:hypothetical protein BN424_3615 [Carnobacterium maltaromaticum LMA28]